LFTEEECIANNIKKDSKKKNKSQNDEENKSENDDANGGDYEEMVDFNDNTGVAPMDLEEEEDQQIISANRMGKRKRLDSDDDEENDGNDGDNANSKIDQEHVVQHKASFETCPWMKLIGLLNSPMLFEKLNPNPPFGISCVLYIS
jgi:hypothetical protein